MKIDTAKVIEEKKKIAEENVKKTMNDYKNFAMKGNIVDMAIGVVIGSAFTNIVNTLVSSTIMPIISVLTNKVDLSTLFIALDGRHYSSIAQAKDAGAIVLEYGLLLNVLLNFFIISFTLFIVMRKIKKVKKKDDKKEVEIKKVTTKECPYCKSTINIDATRCAHCTSVLIEEEEEEECVE